MKRFTIVLIPYWQIHRQLEVQMHVNNDRILVLVDFLERIFVVDQIMRTEVSELLNRLFIFIFIISYCIALYISLWLITVRCFVDQKFFSISLAIIKSEWLEDIKKN